MHTRFCPICDRFQDLQLLYCSSPIKIKKVCSDGQVYCLIIFGQ